MRLIGGPKVGLLRHLKLQQQVREAQHSHNDISTAYSILMLPSEPTCQPPTVRTHLSHTRGCCSVDASQALQQASRASHPVASQQHASMLGASTQAQAPWCTPTCLRATCRSSTLFIPLPCHTRGCEPLCGSHSLVRTALASPPPRLTPSSPHPLTLALLSARVPY